MTRIFYLYPGPDGFVRGWGQADVETEADIAAVLSLPGRVRVDAAVIGQYKAGGTWGWNGEALVAMALPVDIERERAAALWQADQHAEAARRPFLSAGAGQAMEYIWTLEEARAYLASTSPVAADYPLLVAEQAALHANGQDQTLSLIATAVLSDALAARFAMAAIKLKKRTAKIAIRSASSASVIDSAVGAMKA